MRAKLFISLPSAALVLLLGLWLAHPPVSRANGEKDEEKGGHAHVPAPLEYADTHVPLNVWTDQAMIGRGKDIYTTRCAVCHADAGDGKGPAGLASAGAAAPRLHQRGVQVPVDALRAFADDGRPVPHRDRGCTQQRRPDDDRSPGSPHHAELPLHARGAAAGSYRIRQEPQP